MTLEKQNLVVENIGAAEATDVEKLMASPEDFVKDQMIETLKSAEGQSAERMKNTLRGWETTTEDFVKTEGKIDWEAVKKHLHLTQMLALLAQTYLGDILPGFMGIFGNEKVETASFDEEVARLEKSGSALRKVGNNLLYPKPKEGALGIMSMFNTLSQFSGKDAEGKSVLRMVKGSTIIYPRKKQDRTMLSKGQALPRMVDELAKKGIELNIYSSGERVPAAGPNAINVVYAQASGVPDVEALKEYKKIFDRGGTNSAQWYTPDIVAAMLLIGKETDYTVEKAIEIAGADPSISASLEKLKLEDFK